MHVNTYYIYIIHIQWVECSPRVWETRVQSQVSSYQRLLKWYLIPPCLTFSNIRYVSRAKWSNPEKGVAASPTPRCCSYWKGSLLVALDMVANFIYLHIYRIQHKQYVCTQLNAFKFRKMITYFYLIHINTYFIYIFYHIIHTYYTYYIYILNILYIHIISSTSLKSDYIFLFDLYQYI